MRRHIGPSAEDIQARLGLLGPRSLDELVEARWGSAESVWVMGRGLVSEEILEWLRAGGRRYLSGSNKAELERWERADRRSKGPEEVAARTSR